MCHCAWLRERLLPPDKAALCAPALVPRSLADAQGGPSGCSLCGDGCGGRCRSNSSPLLLLPAALGSSSMDLSSGTVSMQIWEPCLALCHPGHSTWTWGHSTLLGFSGGMRPSQRAALEAGAWSYIKAHGAMVQVVFLRGWYWDQCCLTSVLMTWIVGT